MKRRSFLSAACGAGLLELMGSSCSRQPEATGSRSNSRITPTLFTAPTLDSMFQY